MALRVLDLPGGGTALDDVAVQTGPTIGGALRFLPLAVAQINLKDKMSLFLIRRPSYFG